MAGGYLRPYLDANVYIAAVTGPGVEDPAKVEVAERILLEAEAGRIRLIASTLIIAEVAREGDPGAGQHRVFDDFILHSFISWVELDFNLARKARALSQQYGFRGADAVHVASALRGHADAFLSWDTDRLVNRFPAAGIEGLMAAEPYVVEPPQQQLRI